ncbi:metal-sensitive transcriptional regulator [Clostridium rectalis]|uniref:metal-sensitive transcriptional regulator n=1 Tax=Clostridium rectalis TaxID=2040295 RepID=UPI000F63953F|nr:metal-sensitive transcriptional regulator [Clostridium rectalis]
MSGKLEMKKDTLNRLKRIEGQVKGIQRMIENEASCKEVLIQIAAIRSAINKVGTLVFENYAQNCVNTVDDKLTLEVEELLSTLKLFIK